MEIQTLNPATPRQRQRIEAFLKRNGLRIDDMNYYAAVLDDDGEMIAGGGLKDDVIKCVAVDDAHKGEAIANTLVSHLISHANQEGYSCIKLFTKPKNRQLFESLSFRLLAEAPEAILMETGIGGISNTVETLKKIKEESEKYKEYNKECKEDSKKCKEDSKECKEVGKTNLNTTTPQHLNAPYLNTTTPQHLTTTMQPTGCIVMNCNPFTLGHRYLVESASRMVEHLFVIVVREDRSAFSYQERKAMVTAGTADLKNVTVCDGSEYAISNTTFPTYFLKQLSDATDTQILLDLDLFRRHIAPALSAEVRFVGTEPTDELTRRYNELMMESLGKDHVVQIPRLENGGVAVSASRVRRAMESNSLKEAAQLVPPTTLPYIIAHLATRALHAELDTTPKPGLVDKDNSGAHRDMDHALMSRSIRAIHPYFVRLALLGFAADMPSHDDIVKTGIEAERAMFEATNGVNTYKGALFSMGLAVVAAAGKAWQGSSITPQTLSAAISKLAFAFPDTKGTHGSKAKQTAASETATFKGALDNAREGYPMLFNDWLPFYANLSKNGEPHALHLTLLRIICDLDDTNIVYRTSLAMMKQVKEESRSVLSRWSEATHGTPQTDGGTNLDTILGDMNRSFVQRNISPGGSADMLSLVVFINGVLG